MKPALPPQFNLMKRKEFMPSHPRAAEIDAAQPPMMTPNGVGNGAERVHGFGRGS